jgi:hypothetical protein
MICHVETMSSFEPDSISPRAFVGLPERFLCFGVNAFTSGRG